MPLRLYLLIIKVLNVRNMLTFSHVDGFDINIGSKLTFPLYGKKNNKILKRK